MSARIALATCDLQPDLYEEERELLPRLRARGLDARAVSWTAPGVDWRGFDLVVLRSTWDYFEKIDAFRAWLDQLEAANVRLQNPLPLVRWNLDKLYLLDLAEQGVRIVPTRFVRRGERLQLASILEKYGWTDAVVKPTISGGAFRTERVSAADAPAHQAQFERLSAEVGAMVQPFAPEITSEGEWSLFFFGGTFSHAVIKRPASGDYRVQPQFGGAAVRAAPDADLLAAAQKVVSLAPERPLYARVDGFRRGGQLMLMELEAIEPYLFFSVVPEAMDRYVDALAAASRP